MIDGMAITKLNVLHWHLTDSNAFPVGSQLYPELAAKGAYPGAVYPLGTLREIVAYAAERGVRILPEIDIPGRSKSPLQPIICSRSLMGHPDPTTVLSERRPATFYLCLRALY